jgi:hypothetical protein
MVMTVVVIAVVAVVVVTAWVLMFHSQKQSSQDLLGGSRQAIFSRFAYIPDYPMISQMDLKDYDLLSKKYNVADPLELMAGRPYRYYHSPESTWLYPWHFPQDFDHRCLNEASKRCNEPIILVKKETDKMGGMSVETPKDLVRLSPCFNRVYDRCQKTS